jgi:hypothetical protein
MIPIRRFPSRSLLAAFTICLAMATMVAFAGGQQKPQPGPAPAPPERMSVPFSDPARPGRLMVQLVTGSISVKGYEGKEVIVETRVAAEGDDDDGEGRKAERGGLRRIPNTASGLTIEEEQNEMRISTDSPNRKLTLTIQVPTRTALKLATVNDGTIVVERVEGDIEVSNVNGDITLTNVSGTGLLHTVNGELKASFLRVSGKPMSFTTLNGDVDVSLPADVKANVRLDSGQGDIYTDFPIELMPATHQQTVQDDRSKGGKFRIKVEKAMLAKINGGGSEYTFKTYNGNIHLRRTQAGGGQ